MHFGFRLVQGADAHGAPANVLASHNEICQSAKRVISLATDPIARRR